MSDGQRIIVASVLSAALSTAAAEYFRREHPGACNGCCANCQPANQATPAPPNPPRPQPALRWFGGSDGMPWVQDYDGTYYRWNTVIRRYERWSGTAWFVSALPTHIPVPFGALGAEAGK